MRALRGAHRKGEPTPLNIWSLCNLISSALEPLLREKRLKASSEAEEESVKEDTQARNGLSEENVPSQVDRKAVSEDRTLEKTLLRPH